MYDFAVKFCWLIPLLPLLGAMIAASLGRWLRGGSHWPVWLGVLGSAVLSFTLLGGMLALSHGGPNAERLKAVFISPAATQPGQPQAIGVTKAWYRWIEAGADVRLEPAQAALAQARAGLAALQAAAHPPAGATRPTSAPEFDDALGQVRNADADLKALETRLLDGLKKRDVLLNSGLPASDPKVATVDAQLEQASADLARRGQQIKDNFEARVATPLQELAADSYGKSRQFIQMASGQLKGYVNRILPADAELRHVAALRLRGESGPFVVEAGAWLDPLSAVMLCVVTGIGLLIIVFSAGYMKGEAGYFRFFAYMGLFIFAMTILVMANNFVMLYLGWEGVGLCSYLLIGYYYERPSAREAAKKAFLVNRIGDFGFALGIMLIFYIFGSVSFFGDGFGALGVLDHAAPGRHAALLGWVPFLLMLGAFGKSAQFPLHVWLPDAMEGPTPVSALIHAATMVTAGVYMIVRCSALFVTHDTAMMTVAAVGCFTALFAATIALRQFDLKKVFAYSTISQLGYMFLGVGVLAPVAGMFHLVTHAFFKALLFLACGVVMHAMAGELDMRKMSGLKRRPWTRWLMLTGCLALAGFPFFSGFFSKDEILAAAWDRNRLLALVGLATALLTAYYSFRLYFRVFEGRSRREWMAGPSIKHRQKGGQSPFLMRRQ